MFHRWSTCEAPEPTRAEAEPSSSSSSDSSFDLSDNDANNEDSKETEIEENVNKRFTKKEILEKLKENDGDIEKTVTEVLQEAAHNSLEHLNSQDQAALTR